MGKSKDARRLENNQAMAVGNSIRTSSRKLNLVAQSIRGLKAEKAVAELTFSKKRIAKAVLAVFMKIRMNNNLLTYLITYTNLSCVERNIKV